MIGEELGSYRVVEPIGKGGMASVFVGEHCVLGHKVAIKVLHDTNPDNPMVERRFINEAKVIAAIRHPGIVELFDFGRGPSGQAYIVMELLSGETLRSRMRHGGPLPLSQALVFARQIASAVAVAHDKGIVHRDLKPDNIFLVPDAEVEFGERIKVLDFGVAKRLDPNKPADEATAIGVLVGTPAYMSPEQCRGAGEIDHRSDIYSLGIVFFRMVTGQLPFESAGTGELIGKHIYEQAPTVGDIDASVPDEVSQLIIKCLAKAPEDRFQTMHEVAAELRRIRTDVLGETPASARFQVDVRPPVIDQGHSPVGKGVVDDEEETHPTTLRAATGQARPVRPAGRWTWPIAIGGALGLGVFLALFIASSGDQLRKPAGSETNSGVESWDAGASQGVSASPTEPGSTEQDASTQAAEIADASVAAPVETTPDAQFEEPAVPDAGALAAAASEPDAAPVVKKVSDPPPPKKTRVGPKKHRPNTKVGSGTPAQDKKRDQPKKPGHIPVPTLY